MANQYACSAAAFATSTSAKTAATVICGANVPVLLIGWDITSDGTVTTGAFKVELISTNQAGAGTAGGSTIVKTGGTQATAQSTAGTSYSAEPTAVTVLKTWYVPANGGGWAYLWPLGREFKGNVSTTYGIRVTAPSGTPSVCVNLDWEE